jgi:hypothetical protein
MTQRYHSGGYDHGAPMIDALALGGAAYEAYFRTASAEERALFRRWEDLSSETQRQ